MDPLRLSALLDKAFAPRCLARRLIEMRYHELQQLDASNLRRNLVTQGTVGESAIAQRIIDMERQVIACEELERRRRIVPTDDTRIYWRAESIVAQAVQASDVHTIVAVMSGSGAHSLYNLYNRRLQMICMEALYKLCHRNATNKSRLVNCGGIAAILSSAQLHSTCPRLLHKVTALVISVVFYKDSASAYADHMGVSHADKELFGGLIKRRMQEDDSMDSGIASLLINTTAAANAIVNHLDETQAATEHVSYNIFHLIANCVEHNLFHVCLHQPGDENGNYERLLAIKQIPLICRSIHLLANDPARLRRRLLFLRSCLASYLGDTSLTTDTLGAIVL
ncbi:hypothetical protein MPSEU_000456500 [Mayamaea pseudoterrestris]|nr:hypothetical protein MPSEU_000456500 [Mayamaea pseudoterrestris]